MKKRQRGEDIVSEDADVGIAKKVAKVSTKIQEKVLKIKGDAVAETKEEDAHTWCVVALWCGSGMVWENCLFSSQDDLKFFWGHDSYGVPPRLKYGSAVPLLSLEAAKKWATTMYAIDGEDEEKKAEEAVERFKKQMESQFESEGPKRKMLDVQNGGPYYVHNFGLHGGEAFAFVLAEEDHKAYRKWENEKDHGDDVFTSHGSYGMDVYTMESMNASREEMLELFEMEEADHDGPPCCI